MRKLQIGSIPLPTVYVVSDRSEINKCRRLGIPYVVWHGEYDMLVKLVLLPTLMKMFPYINWSRELGVTSRNIRSADKLTIRKQVVEREQKFSERDPKKTMEDVEEFIEDGLEKIGETDDRCDDGGARAIDFHAAQDYRPCGSSGFDVDISLRDENLRMAVGDLSAFVDIQELQKLRIMPTWLSDLTDAIRRNIDDYVYMEGWNKKLGCALGNFNGTQNAPNLIILDVSASIPYGVAATMLSLIETLREQANADLIVTAATSGWYPSGSKLPSPEQLRKLHPRGQEYEMFNVIMSNHVLGREWGNVIAFGDNDSPEVCYSYAPSSHKELHSLAWSNKRGIPGTKVHKLWSCHTMNNHCFKPPIVGYARWASTLCPDVEVEKVTSWVKSFQ